MGRWPPADQGLGRLLLPLQIVLRVPLRELPEAFPQSDLGRKTKISFQGRGVSVGGGDVAGLHRDEFFVRFEIVVLREDAGAEEPTLRARIRAEDNVRALNGGGC